MANINMEKARVGTVGVQNLKQTEMSRRKKAI